MHTSPATLVDCCRAPSLFLPFRSLGARFFLHPAWHTVAPNQVKPRHESGGGGCQAGGWLLVCFPLPSSLPSCSLAYRRTTPALLVHMQGALFLLLLLRCCCHCCWSKFARARYTRHGGRGREWHMMKLQARRAAAGPSRLCPLRLCKRCQTKFNGPTGSRPPAHGQALLPRPHDRPTRCRCWALHCTPGQPGKAPLAGSLARSPQF